MAISPPALLALQDPAIKQMAEQIANDDTFKQITEQLQAQFGGMMAPPGGEGAQAREGPPGAAGMPNPAAFDPSKYMQAMSGMFSNPQFMQMAEQLGRTIIEVRGRSAEVSAGVCGAGVRGAGVRGAVQEQCVGQCRRVWSSGAVRRALQRSHGLQACVEPRSTCHACTMCNGACTRLGVHGAHALRGCHALPCACRKIPRCHR